ncbi:MAG TPA: AbrB family transcriptional regulator [Hyphomicrobiaceae bacterium]|nr:AbrB family transcriptional regulator [Hyphomicrobiaceae bacterium]
MVLKPSLSIFLRALLCIALGFGGGAIAALLHIPLPYMLGSIAITMFAALAGIPVARPAKVVVLPMRVVLGVLLGSTMTPELLDRIGALAGSAAMVPIFVITATILGTTYYHRVAGYSREEAFFSAVPGGLHVMTNYAEDTGVDIRRVSLAHALRITFVVILAPLATKFLMDVPDINVSQTTATFMQMNLRDMVLLIIAGLVGWLAGRMTGMPGAQMVGPMLASAALHISGITAAKPPVEIILMSQVILGAYIGSRYVGEKLTLVRDSMIYAFGHVVMMLCLGFCFAYMLHIMFDVPVITALLSFAPGGMSEIGLIALALGLDVGFVATVQVSRSITISLLAPAAWARIRRLVVTDDEQNRSSRKTPPEGPPT